MKNELMKKLNYETIEEMPSIMDHLRYGNPGTLDEAKMFLLGYTAAILDSRILIKVSTTKDDCYDKMLVRAKELDTIVTGSNKTDQEIFDLAMANTKNFFEE